MSLVILASFWTTLKDIVLFIIALGFLVCIHELGHFSMAKLFKVYCQEFSIGFGPKLFSKKRKNGETTFSIRCVPLGGYVSMYGEGDDSAIDPALNVPPERSLLGIKKWKRALIMSAGIILNFALAYVLFAGNTIFFKQTFGTNQVHVAEGSLASETGLIDGDYVTAITLYGTVNGVTTERVTTKIETYNDIWGTALVFGSPETVDDTLNISLTVYRDQGTEDTADDETKVYTFALTTVSTINEDKTDATLSWKTMGISGYTFQARYGFGKALKVAGEDWWESCTLIGKAFVTLFSKEGFSQLGGPLAIFKTSSTVLENYGFGMYLKLWGMISVNLAIFNLLPFPGLDGWHLLVVCIEGIFRKEIPNKVKNVISLVGMILLFGLMIVVFVKDIITFTGLLLL